MDKGDWQATVHGGSKESGHNRVGMHIHIHIHTQDLKVCLKMDSREVVTSRFSFLSFFLYF